MYKILGIGLAVAMLLSVSAISVAAYPIGEVITVSLPRAVPTGHKPFAFSVALTNSTDKPFSFDGLIKHGGKAWGAEDYPYTFSDGTEVYDVHCAAAWNACYHFWRGTVQPGQSVSFTIDTFSGNTVGKFRFLKVRLITTLFDHEYIQRTRSIRVTNG